MTTSSSVPDNGGDHSGGGGSGGGYVDDVFSTYVYEGSQSVANLKVVNGINLNGEGGMVWVKKRDGATNHYLMDTVRGKGKQLHSNETMKEGNTGVVSFDADGFTVPFDNGLNINNADFVSWTFRKAKKFFDVVTYTGNGASGYQIPHNLGCRPGMIIAKKLDDTGSWWTWHGGLPNNDGSFAQASKLDDNSAAGSFKAFMLNEEQTDKVFTLSGVSNRANDAGAEYVAYLFAHDDSDESIIKCGSYTGNGNADGPEIDLGWEPQFVLIKSATTAKDWNMFDTMRGIPTGGADAILMANESAAESVSSNSVNSHINLLPNGFQLANNSSQTNDPSQDYIYMAIRRPNKPAEEFEPEELFKVSTGDNRDPSFVSGFVTDFSLWKKVESGHETYASSRLTSTRYLVTHKTDAETISDKFTWDYMDGFSNESLLATAISQMWRRAPGFFDVVAYEAPVAVGSPYELPHNLGVKPEMMWVKRREWEREWYVYAGPLGAEKFMHLDMNTAAQDQVYAWNDTEPTDTHFTVGSNLTGVNQQYITYLFASVPGICDIGSYTGNGGDLDIDCGFTNGARFVLIKRTDEAGDWMYFDTVRGITVNTSNMLKLNKTDAQVANYYVKPYPLGFGLHTTGSVNSAGGTYIYYAIA
jgi:hypothetical protein